MIAIPQEIGRLTALNDLYVRRAFFGLARMLTALPQLNRNKITALSLELCRLHALKRLDVRFFVALVASLTLRAQLSSNALTSLPSEMCQLTSLELLYVGKNQLAWLPMELDRLTAAIFVSCRPAMYSI